MMRPLPRSFYARPVLTVARACIGKLLVHEDGEGRTVGRIVEVEAYRGPEDRAAHSYAGRRTPRTEVMFGEAGHAYMFFVYGMHWHLNLVAGNVGQPHAVLVRAVEPLEGVERMAARRGLDGAYSNRKGELTANLTNGPGKLCQAFAIDRAQYGADLTSSALYLADNGATKPRVARSTRIGVDYAAEWALKPWRFYDAGSRFVSRFRAPRT
ncbi:MAG: DNA-3-methyladenine glycosylase [Polyangiaceae bacterium]